MVFLVWFNFEPINQQSQKSAGNPKFHALRVTSDMPANIYLNGVLKGKTGDKMSIQILVKQGTYKLRAVSVNFPGKFKEQQIKISEIGKESNLHFSLKPEFEASKERKQRTSNQQSVEKVETLQANPEILLPQKQTK